MSKKIKEKLCKIIACLIATLCVLPVAGVAASTKHADLADKFVECTTTLNYTTATAYTRINRPNADKLTVSATYRYVSHTSGSVSSSKKSASSKAIATVSFDSPTNCNSVSIYADHYGECGSDSYKCSTAETI